jgi:hypothetical protein
MLGSYTAPKIYKDFYAAIKSVEEGAQKFTLESYQQNSKENNGVLPLL